MDLGQIAKLLLSNRTVQLGLMNKAFQIGNQLARDSAEYKAQQAAAEEEARKKRALSYSGPLRLPASMGEDVTERLLKDGAVFCTKAIPAILRESQYGYDELCQLVLDGEILEQSRHAKGAGFRLAAHPQGSGWCWSRMESHSLVVLQARVQRQAKRVWMSISQAVGDTRDAPGTYSSADEFAKETWQAHVTGVVASPVKRGRKEFCQLQFSSGCFESRPYRRQTYVPNPALDEASLALIDGILSPIMELRLTPPRASKAKAGRLTGEKSIADQLEQLGDMLQKGLLTKAEFAKAKKLLLSESPKKRPVSRKPPASRKPRQSEKRTAPVTPEALGTADTPNTPQQ
jgi:hypothetical protein